MPDDPYSELRLSQLPYIQFLQKWGDLPQITRGDPGGGNAAEFNMGSGSMEDAFNTKASENITLDPNLEGKRMSEVLGHELGHSFQHQTTGMQPNNPTELAIRQRLGIPAYAPEKDRRVSEEFAGLLSAPKTASPLADPIMGMILRALASQIFGRAFSKGVPAR